MYGIILDEFRARRDEWVKRYSEELNVPSAHVYDLRFLAICRDIVNNINSDPSYVPPTFEEVIKDSPWGP